MARVLVVDDEAVIRRLVRLSLEAVSTTPTVLEAAERLG